MNLLFKKLALGRIWRRIFNERLAEPLHLNLLSLPVALFGSVRSKINHDLIIRHAYAWGLLRAADLARWDGFRTVSILEFGVARGEGLLNMVEIAQRITRETGVKFKIYGFDTGKGMPASRDYRDHPAVYRENDFPMDVEALTKRLAGRAELILGEVDATVGGFLERLPAEEPIGFVSIDVDYYSSATSALRVLTGPTDRYVRLPVVYLDDIAYDFHNNWCGELLAVNEFNQEHELRKVEPYRFLEQTRIFRRATWIKQIYQLHLLDREPPPPGKQRVLDNRYLD